MIWLDGEDEMRRFWQIFYVLAGVGALFYSFMYFGNMLTVDNITMGMYCFGFGCTALGEALRR